MSLPLTKPQQLKRLLANVEERISWEGAVKVPAGKTLEHWVLSTSAGLLRISFEADDIKRDHDATISIYCCFDDPTAIKAFGLTGNSYSGKWNWHYLNQDGVNAFFVSLQKILATRIEGEAA